MLAKKFTNKTFAKWAMVLMMLLLTVSYTIPWTLRHSLETKYSGVDFHGYWYAGHYLRQGVNSYAAILNDPKPAYWDPRIPGSGDPWSQGSAEYALELPIYYLDGLVVREYPVAQAMIVAPSVTAPLNFLMGLLSWFSWPWARLIWMALNLAFAAVIPWLAIRLIDKHYDLSLVDKLLFALIVYNFYGLRQAIVVGQQSLICLLFLVLALLFREKWLISGILLGLGISKYSVGLPILIYFLIEKEYRVVLTSIFLQIIGIALLIPLKWGSPMETLTAYLKALELNYSQNGVHFLARIPDIKLQIALFSIILFLAIFFLVWHHFGQKSFELEGNRVNFSILSLITLAIFLTTYHRIHDMPFMIFFLLLMMTNLVDARNISLSQTPSIIVPFLVVGVIGLLVFPTALGNIAARMGIVQNVAENWSSPEAAASISLLLMFALTIWLQFRPTFHANIPVEPAK